MRKLHLLLLALVISIPAINLPAQEKESDQRSIFERIFGILGEREAAKEEREQARKEADDDEYEEEADEKKAVGKKFSEKERRILGEWQKESGLTKDQYKKLPPGLQKKVDRGGELPPGWKKKLEIGETLDEDVAEQARKLPEEILKRLPQIEEGIEILEVGGEVIKVVEESLEIIDILSGSSEED